MYITNRFICFYSNLFGLEKKIRIPYSHIRSITKENTAMVIPNAIAISTGMILTAPLNFNPPHHHMIYHTDKKDYTFRSFWDREDCYRILTAFLSKFRGVTTELPGPSKQRLAAMRNSTSALNSSAHGGNSGLTSIPEGENGGLTSEEISSRHQSLPSTKRNPSAAGLL